MSLIKDMTGRKIYALRGDQFEIVRFSYLMVRQIQNSSHTQRNLAKSTQIFTVITIFGLICHQMNRKGVITIRFFSELTRFRIDSCV